MSPGKIPEISAARSQSAHIQRPWLGGEEVCDAIAAFFPEIEQMAVESRAFLCRAVRYLAGKEGVHQFLDLYAGLPTVGSLHQVAQRAAPQDRIVYAGKDLLTPARTRAPLDGGVTSCIDAALDQVLAQAVRTLDFCRPVAILLCSVLPHVTDDEEASSVVRRLVDALPPEGFLVLSHDTADAPGGNRLQKAMELHAERGGLPLVARDREQVTRFAEGLELVEPGVVWTSYWRPAPAPWEPVPIHQYALVARKP